MEVERKQRIAAMAVVLAELDDEALFFPVKRSCWQKDYIANKHLGMQYQLYRELLLSDSQEYRRLLRVSREQFVQLLSLVGPRIQRQDTVMRRAISAETRLQVTLRYLASGKCCTSVHFYSKHCSYCCIRDCSDLESLAFRGGITLCVVKRQQGLE
uniref:Uncharacterized protein n=1 Tax=Rhipicephalus microplus TaxID=6941 RepID=A0A6G5A944_RHIMP